MNKNQLRTVNGSALLTVLIIMGVLAFALTSMVLTSTQLPYSVRHTCDSIKAQAIAEAGANIAYAMLSTNFALKDNASAFPETSYGGGKYDVTVQSMSTTSAVLTSVGYYSSATSTVAMDVINIVSNTASGQPGAVGLFKYAIASGTSIDGGNSSAGDGINGDVTAPVITDKKGKITGTKTIGTVNVSNLINLTPYYNYAVANGAMYTGDQSFRDYTAPGGVAWVQGNVSLKGSIVGCIIATGNITCNGGFTLTQVANYPALVSQNGSISMNNNSLSGLVYAPQGNVTLGGNASITGTIIAGGTVSFSGCSELFANSTPVAPGSGGTVSTVGIGAWRQ